MLGKLGLPFMQHCDVGSMLGCNLSHRLFFAQHFQNYLGLLLGGVVVTGRSFFHGFQCSLARPLLVSGFTGPLYCALSSENALTNHPVGALVARSWSRRLRS